MKGNGTRNVVKESWNDSEQIKKEELKEEIWSSIGVNSRSSGVRGLHNNKIPPILSQESPYAGEISGYIKMYLKIYDIYTMQKLYTAHSLCNGLTV